MDIPLPDEVPSDLKPSSDMINAAQDVFEKISWGPERKVYYDHSNASPTENSALTPAYSLKLRAPWH
jgi:hypothetical protein